MPATGKVSLTRQTIYCFIPVMDLYAAYHIKKLRWYLLIMLAVGLAMGMVSSVINPMDEIDETRIISENKEIDWNYVFLGDNPAAAVASFVINQGVVIAVAVFLIRRWSKKWNLQFDAQSQN
ncbi:MAG: hypothetical protein OEM77_01710 [Nitrosopumilus sp.]|nr:hypothetical protein [Nitrosopumilus sp.]MDH3735784.1 hypothetical protein [Nitrosopumilus sp.]MDH3823220.1 hypothetical protein [Nitrosopumilus sp.]MDH3834232.1 hypothetical protein [Nitrosopumilus sp.]